MIRFFVRVAIVALAFGTAIWLTPGLDFVGEGLAAMVGFIGIALLFGLLNAPVAKLMSSVSHPALLLIIGLTVIFVNFFALMLVNRFADSLFKAYGFGAVFWGSCIISIASLSVSLFLADGKSAKQNL